MADLATQIATLVDGMNLSDDQITKLTQNLATLKQQSILESDDAIARARDGSRLTKRGFDLLAKAISGKELRYSRVSFGDSVRDGTVVIPSIEEGVEFTDLISWRMDLPMASVDFTGAGTVAIKFSVKNATITEGFWARELGLFALDPDTGEEVLYCYRNAGLLAEYIPAGGGAVVWDIIMTLITVVDQASNVTAVLDANLAYVSQSEFSLHVTSENPHPNIPTLSTDVTSTSHVWAIDEDKNLHRLSTEDLAKIILGGDAGDIPKMNSRLTQTEINLANLYMQLYSQSEMGLTANLLLVEDFSKNEHCDLYECVVVNSFAGSSQLVLESDRGVLSGHWYTITDGVNSEYVQVRSVARNGNTYAVFLEQELVYTYNVENTRLLRSTALISGGKAYGAGDLRGVVYQFDEIFAGTGGNVATILQLDTSQKNSSAFTLEGDAAFTTNGEFTLTA